MKIDDMVTDLNDPVIKKLIKDDCVWRSDQRPPVTEEAKRKEQIRRALQQAEHLLSDNERWWRELAERFPEMDHSCLGRAQVTRTALDEVIAARKEALAQREQGEKS